LYTIVQCTEIEKQSTSFTTKRKLRVVQCYRSLGTLAKLIYNYFILSLKLFIHLSFPKRGQGLYKHIYQQVNPFLKIVY
jgi:hypothetical protein